MVSDSLLIVRRPAIPRVGSKVVTECRLLRGLLGEIVPYASFFFTSFSPVFVGAYGTSCVRKHKASKNYATQA